MDHRVHFKRILEAHNFIFVPDVGLKIGTLDISGSLFLNLRSELSLEVWITSYRHLKTEFLKDRAYICYNLTPAVRPPPGQDLTIHLIYDIL